VGTKSPLIGIISNVQDVTADFFEAFLKRAGIPSLRINTDQLGRYAYRFRLDSGVPSGRCRVEQTEFDFDAISAIYYRRPTLPELDIDDPGWRVWAQNEYRKAWGGILAGLTERKWVNDPLAISRASYKPEQIMRAARSGLMVPDTLITNSPSEAEVFCRTHAWDVIAKPIGHGEIRGDVPQEDQVVYTNLLRADGSDSLNLVANCPTLFQVHVHKEYDLRITVVGNRCFPVALHSQERNASQVDCRRDNMQDMRYSVVDLPISLTSQLVGLVRSYDLYFGAIDLVKGVDGRYWFLELNPAGQWAWLEQKVDVPISNAIAECLLEEIGTSGRL
jgi:hypothetical protein